MRKSALILLFGVSVGRSDGNTFPIRSILAWLPSDTEALVVANTKFVHGVTQQDIRTQYADLALAAVPSTQDSDVFYQAFKTVVVRSAAYAGRRFRPISGKTGLGLVAAMEGCSILSLSNTD